MLNRRFVLLSFIASSALSSCASPPVIDVQAEIEAVRDFDLAWQAAFAAGDVEEALSFLAPDAVMMGPNAPAVVGREAHRGDFEAYFADPDVSSSWTAEVIEVSASGDLAYYRGTYHATVQTPEGPVEDVGKFLAVCKKIDGEWKVIAESTNSDLPVVQQ
jgi:uncharacterized protein (TIGR02246 family)